jgi:hypothetical protein
LNSAALIKYIKTLWDANEDLTDLVGELHGISRINEDFKLPYARIAVENDDHEYTGTAFLPYYYILIAVYSLQASETHHEVSKLIKKLLTPCKKACIPEDNPESYMRILHILPVKSDLALTEATLAGRDVLVSTYQYKLLIQENCIPEESD